MRNNRDANRPAGAGNASEAAGADLAAGSVVRDRLWGGRHSGTVLRRDGRSVFVAWHGTSVEDELDIEDVDLCVGAPAELAAWRGGITAVAPDGTVTVEPLDGRS